MDKCIKVLIPTGEVRLILDEESCYVPADKKSNAIACEFADGDYLIMESSSDNWIGSWVGWEDECGELLFPVIAQYGDEFPV